MSAKTYGKPVGTSGLSPGPDATGPTAHLEPNYERIVQNPHFQELVHERTRFGWILTATMLVIYFGFIGLIAFDKALLATKVGGGTVSLGFCMGIAVIVLAFLLTGIYVVRANGRFDDLTADLKRSLGQ